MKDVYSGFIKENQLKGIKNPYGIFGYELRFEDFNFDFSVKRVINGVEIFSTDDVFILFSKREDLITLVDLLEFASKGLNFRNSRIDLNLDRLNILDRLLKEDEREYLLPLSSTHPVDYIEIRHTLIYTITGAFEDPYFRDIMLKTKENSVFDA